MANTSTRDTRDLRVQSGGANVVIDPTANTVTYLNATGNLDARMDTTSVPTLSDDLDHLRIRLDVSQLTAAFWVANNEYKFGVFDGTSATIYAIWLTGTAGAPATLDLRRPGGSASTVAFDPLVHRYLGVRHDSGGNTMHWEYSTDGVNWVDLGSEATDAAFDPTDIQIWQLRLENTANATNIGTCVVSQINTPAPVARTWDGYVKGINSLCRSEGPAISELDASTAFRLKFKIDGDIFHRVVAGADVIDLLLLRNGAASIPVRLAQAGGNLVHFQLRTPDDSITLASFDVSAIQSGTLLYCDVGQFGTNMWLRATEQVGAAFIVDVVDNAATALTGLTGLYPVLWPVVGDDVGHSLAADDSAPLRIGGVSLWKPSSGTPWTDTADQVRAVPAAAATDLIEYWPLNDGVHATVYKGREGNYDILAGGTDAVDRWSLPSSRPMRLDVDPTGVTFVENTGGSDVANPAAGAFEDGIAKLHREGSTSTNTFRLNNDTTEIDLSYGGEHTFWIDTTHWPTEYTTTAGNNQSESVRTADDNNILGMALGRLSGGSTVRINQNYSLNGSFAGENGADVSDVIAHGPWIIRKRVEGDNYYLDYCPTDAAAGNRDWTTLGPLSLSTHDIRQWGGATKSRRSNKTTKTSWASGDWTGYLNEQIGGPFAGSIIAGPSRLYEDDAAPGAATPASVESAATMFVPQGKVMRLRTKLGGSGSHSAGVRSLMIRPEGVGNYVPIEVWSALPSPILQWDASQISAANDDPIGSWVDEVAGVDLTASGAARPLYKTNVVGSMPGILFDGVDDTMTCVEQDLGTVHTIFMVVQHAVTGGTHTYLEKIATGNGSFFRRNGGQLEYRALPSGPQSFFNGGLNTAQRVANTPHVYGISRNGVVGRPFADGSEFTPADDPDDVGYMLSRMGAGAGPVNLMAGHFFELLVYDVAMDTATWQAISTLLTAKWS